MATLSHSANSASYRQKRNMFIVKKHLWFVASDDRNTLKPAALQILKQSRLTMTCHTFLFLLEYIHLSPSCLWIGIPIFLYLFCLFLVLFLILSPSPVLFFKRKYLVVLKNVNLDYPMYLTIFSILGVFQVLIKVWYHFHFGN